jgi:hypothetical protein
VVRVCSDVSCTRNACCGTCVNVHSVRCQSQWLFVRWLITRLRHSAHVEAQTAGRSRCVSGQLCGFGLRILPRAQASMRSPAFKIDLQRFLPCIMCGYA